MKIFIQILIFIFLSSIIIIPQTDTTELIDSEIFNLKENLFENNEDAASYDFINQLLSNPIDINNVTAEELSNIPFLSIQDAQTIIKDRKRKKFYKSFNDFKTIKGVHPYILLLLKPFIVFNDIYTKNIFSAKIHSRLFSDLQNPKGYLDSSYSGSKVKSYNKIGITYGDFKSRILIEKDAGEKSYFDYSSGFVSYNSKNFIPKIIVGDYNFEFGQGLAIWSPYGYSKGSDALNFVSKRDRGIIPHTSSDENRFFRGIAVESKIKKFRLNAFYSLNKIDASINEFNEVTSLVITGYHRTENEIAKKHNLSERTLGASLKYQFSDFLDIGFFYMKNNFEKKLNFRDKFSLHGNKFQFTSFSYKLFLDRFNLLGEISHNGKSIATVANIYLGLSDEIQFVTSFRNYPKNYSNIYSSGFGETNNTQNEQGYYFGVRINSNFGRFNIYYDIFKFPYSNYTNGLPSNGNDFLINYEKVVFKGTKLNLKIKDEIKEMILSEDLDQNITNQEKLNVRLTFEYGITKSILGKSRFEYVKFSELNDKEDGYLLYQDLKLKLVKYFSLTTRIIFFQTKSYNSRLYEFENDLRGVLTNLAMFGEGFRWYLLVKYSPSSNFYIYLKYSETYKPNEKSLGSGDNEIFGNIDNKISTQFEVRL